MAAPNDPLYPQQWHFNLIGDIETIWQEYSGAGVTVAVYDDGVDYTHPDLAPNYDHSLHYQNGGVVYDPYPIGWSDAHGTAVAGIIGAVGNNGIGGTGVAPGVTLTGVNFLNSLQHNATLYYDSLRWAAQVDVMNNSWGMVPLYASYQSLVSGQGAMTNAAFGHVVGTGRDGLGTVIVQAAGNEGMNANGSALNGSRFTISVAATDTQGWVHGYSNFGSNMLIAAPAASVTTDIVGNPGYSSGDYTFTFGGTSAATPVVSGVVALMLEANDALGWRDIHTILAMSASQTGSAFGTSGSGNEIGNWFSNGAGNWNGGGLTYHYSYGYGMLDAFAAVRMAEVWSILHGSVPRTSANEASTTVSQSPNAAIQFGTNERSVQVNPSILIESIMLTVNLTHAAGSELSIELVAPDGTVFTVMAGESVNTGGGFNWTFGIAGAQGMMSSGNWTLRIIDSNPANNGTLHSFRLDFFGATAPSYLVHHITADFAELAAVETARQTLTPTTAQDWLNLAALAGNVGLDLSPGGQLQVDGDNWATMGGAFRRIMLGDGDNHVQASDLSTLIRGGRGDDTLVGGFGNDTLVGGLGSDVLFAGSGNNRLEGGEGDDSLFGGSGNDTLVGEAGDDWIEGGEGDDRILGGIGDDTLYGGAGRDTIFGGEGSDLIYGGDGDDSLFGGGLGINHIYGDAGNDWIQGGIRRDFIYGGEGNDTVYGNAGHDVIYGGEGNDLLFGGGGNDWISGGPGHDDIRGGVGDDTLFGDAGNDTIFGGPGNDWIDGGPGNDVLFGGAGNDTLFGGLGNDLLRGGVDNDVLYGGPGNDTLLGLAGDDWLDGGEGDDLLEGGGGRDTLIGGAGNDTLTGGPGADSFVFQRGFDTNLITDFEMAQDRLVLDPALWGEGLSLGQMLDLHGGDEGGDYVLRFDDGTVIILENLAGLNTALLETRIDTVL